MPNNKPRWFFPLEGRKSEGTVDSSEQRHEAGEETKSEDEATPWIRCSLFLQLHLPQGVFQRPGGPPSWHLSPLWGNTGTWRCSYQRGGLGADAITWFQIPNTPQRVAARVSSCVPEIKHGVSPPAKSHESLLFALQSTRVLYILLLQTQFKSEKKGALKEKEKKLLITQWKQKSHKSHQAKTVTFKVRKERINYNQWWYQVGNRGTSLPWYALLWIFCLKSSGKLHCAKLLQPITCNYL